MNGGNMLCMGWREMTCTPDKFGRNQQIVAPAGKCSAAWFYLGLAVIAGVIIAK